MANTVPQSNTARLQILGHHSILTTSRYTHLTSHTADQCSVRINALMAQLAIGWGAVL